MNRFETTHDVDMWTRNELWASEADVDWADAEVTVVNVEHDEMASIYITNEQVVELRDWLNAYIKEHIT